MAIEELLRRAAAAHRIGTERALAPFDITPAQFAVLQIVARMPGVSSAEVARIERLTPPTLSVVVANLERKRALIRRAHAKSARIQCLEATALGLELHRSALTGVETLHARLESTMPAGAREAIRTWLLRVAEIEV